MLGSAHETEKIIYGRHEFRKQPEPVDVDEIVRESGEIRIGTETALAE